MMDVRLEENLNRKIERLVLEMCTRQIQLPLALREFGKSLAGRFQ